MSAPALHSLPGPEPENTKQKLRSPGLRLAQQFEAICYWLTMASLAIATVYLAYRTVSNRRRQIQRRSAGVRAHRNGWSIVCRFS